ncbi:flagellar hook-length control protein FliK [Paenibacillus sp. TRM 82003]|nr:flagellar hook-length control protein FliK [Paenibacillus sp. TRM 82003]
MNGIQTILTAYPSQGASAAGAALPGSNGDASMNASAFAALFAGLLNGEAMPAEAQGMTLQGLLSGLSGETALPAEEGESSEDTVAWEAILSQLSVMFGTLAPELKQQLAEQPDVQQWMALANAELAMAGEETAVYDDLLAPETTNRSEADPLAAQRLSGLLERLAAALQANPQSAHLSAAAEQAGKLISNAIAKLMTGEPLTTNATASVLNSGVSLSADKALRTKSGTMEQVSALLEKTNGVVAKSTGTEADTAIAKSTARSLSHLSAMEAKTSFLRFTTVDVSATASTTTAETGGAASAQGNAGEPTLTTAGGLVDATRTGLTETTKTEALPQRVPLTNAAEHLNEWILKQTSGGGSLKSETVIRLMPEHLGQVEVKLSLQNGQLTATIMTESAAARDVLESNLAALRSNLQTQGVTVERLVVSHNQTNGFQSGMFQEERGRQSQERDSARDQRSRKDENSDDWADVLAVSGDQDLAALTTEGSSFQAQA